MAVGAQALARRVELVYSNEGVVVINVGSHQFKQVFEFERTYGRHNLLLLLLVSRALTPYISAHYCEDLNESRSLYAYNGVGQNQAVMYPVLPAQYKRR